MKKKLILILLSFSLNVSTIVLCSDNAKDEHNATTTDTDMLSLLDSIPDKVKGLEKKYSDLSTCTNDEQCTFASTVIEPCYCGKQCSFELNIRKDLVESFKREHEPLTQKCQKGVAYFAKNEFLIYGNCPIALCPYNVIVPQCIAGKCSSGMM